MRQVFNEICKRTPPDTNKFLTMLYEAVISRYKTSKKYSQANRLL